MVSPAADVVVPTWPDPAVAFGAIDHFPVGRPSTTIIDQTRAAEAASAVRATDAADGPRRATAGSIPPNIVRLIIVAAVAIGLFLGSGDLIPTAGIIGGLGLLAILVYRELAWS